MDDSHNSPHGPAACGTWSSKEEHGWKEKEDYVGVLDVLLLLGGGH